MVSLRGGGAYPTIFNVAVNSVVRHCLSLIVEDGAVVHDGLGQKVDRSLGVFYMNDVLLIYWDPEWLQFSLNILIGMFWKIFLVYNVTKSNTITCHSGAIVSGISQEAFGRSNTGEGSTYRERLRRRVPCPD